jgi:hypothetical protein
MKKILSIYCFLAILFINSASGGYAQNNNSEVLGELFVSINSDFSMYIPRGWEIVDFSVQYQVVRGPADNNFVPNLTFGVDEYSGPITEYIDQAIEVISVFYTEFKILQRGNFVTDSGYQGEIIIIQGNIGNMGAVRQRLYCFRSTNGTSIIGITGTASAAHGGRYDVIFDECLKTFNWLR